MIQNHRRSALTRRGTILIIVSGLCALMASLSLAFLTRMRSDAQESRLVLADTQARIMLVAGLNYIQEASRLGWDDLSTINLHEEAYGWIDVRDGELGPKTTSTQPRTGEPVVRRPENGPASLKFPIGGVAARFPMFVRERPPYAVSFMNAHNPISTNTTQPDFGLPYLRYPDPQPVVFNNWVRGTGGASVNAAKFGDPTKRFDTNKELYLFGDPRPRTNSVGLGWFRIYRKGPATFIVTCGSGSSGGHREWNTMLKTEQDEYGGDAVLWASLRAAEVLMWFEAEWSPAVGGATYQCIDNEQHPDHYQWRPFNTTHEGQSQTHSRNMVGTFRYIQRLRFEPDQW